MKIRWLFCFALILLVPALCRAQEEQDAFFYGKTESFKKAHEVFQVSCLPCHSSRQPLAWHARLPVLSSLKKKEFREALNGINLDETVYVAGLTPSLETLDEIEAVIQKEEMPPFDYVVTHWKARLSKKEKWAILDWIRDERREYLQAGAFSKPRTVVVSGVEMFEPFVPDKKQVLADASSRENSSRESSGEKPDSSALPEAGDANPFRPRGF